MKALQINGYGDVKTSLAFYDIETPKIKANQVLISVYAASTNPIDYKIIEGVLKRILKLSFPTRIGYDVAGVVKEKGEQVKGLNVGDEVIRVFHNTAAVLLQMMLRLMTIRFVLNPPI